MPTKEEREEFRLFLQKLIEILPAYGEIERSAACFGVQLFEFFAPEQ